jgi:hypothetical protein
MQDDWEFCSRDLAATSQLLQPVGSGSGLVFADRFHQLSAAECSSAASLSHDISMKARDTQGSLAHPGCEKPSSCGLLFRTWAT